MLRQLLDYSMSLFQTSSVRREHRIGSAISLVLFGLTFVWSITGTIALRHALLALMLGITPFAGVSVPALKRCMTQATVLLLLALTCWIVIQNQFLAWNSSRAWHESTQWFKAMTCLGIGLTLGCAPRLTGTPPAWRRWVWPIAAAWSLHLLLNLAVKDWDAQPLGEVLQGGTPIGTRDMVSYLGCGLLALLLADGAGRAAGRLRVFPLSIKFLWTGVLATTLLTAATMTRNAILVMALELAIAMTALIGVSGNKQQRSRRYMLALAAMLLLATMALANFTLDARWKNFHDSVQIAWDIEHNKGWIDQVANPLPTNAQGTAIDQSAYSRIAWIRGAAYLITKYPLGTGYDRNAFRHALMKHYGAASTASGHAHAGLLDFTLATGIPGGLMFIAALLAAIGSGWRRWRANHDTACLALVLFVAGYLLRAAVDGIIRDHMLEQAMFVTGLLLAASVAAASTPRETKP